MIGYAGVAARARGHRRGARPPIAVGHRLLAGLVPRFFDHGTVVATGRHADLLVGCPTYRRLLEHWMATDHG